jgi:hypothetical protein
MRGRTFSWTNDSDIQVNVSTLDSVSFDVSRNTSTAGNGFRIAVQICRPMVRDVVAQSTRLKRRVRTFDGSADSFTFNWTNTQHFMEHDQLRGGTRSINTTLGTVGSDLSGTVQSIGLYTETTGNFGVFIDNFTVAVVPEPSTYAFYGGSPGTWVGDAAPSRT